MTLDLCVWSLGHVGAYRSEQLIAKLRKVAMASPPGPVRARQRSSSKVALRNGLGDPQ